MNEVQFAVPTMTCNHCVESITKEVNTVDGVDHVKIDLETKLVLVTGSQLNASKIADAIEEAGYEAQSLNP